MDQTGNPARPVTDEHPTVADERVSGDTTTAPASDDRTGAADTGAHHRRSERRRPRVLRVLLSFPLLFSLVATLFVGAFVAVVPAGFGLDEMHHTYRAWQVSRGQLEVDTITPKLQYGGQIPVALVDYELEGTDASNAGRTSGQYWQRADVDLGPDLERFGAVHLRPDSPTQLEDFTNAGASSFVAYAPAALGMRIGTVLGLDVAGIVLLGKAASGLVYVVLVAAAAVVLRGSRWRWLVALVALLPQSVFQASIITADTLSNGTALLFVAGVLALRHRTVRATWPLLAVTIVAALGVVAAKPTYILLLPLLFTVPAVALGLRRRRWALAVEAGAVALVAGVGAALSSGAADIADAIRTQVPDWPSVDRHLQLQGILADPLHLVGVVARTFVQYGSSWVEGSITMLGTNSVFVPQPVAVALIVVLVLAALRGDGRAPIAGLVFIAVAAVSVVAVIATLYLTFSTVGAANANGVQGRYWLPLFVPLAAGLGMLLPIRVGMSERAAAVTFSSVGVAALVAALVTWVWVVY